MGPGLKRNFRADLRLAKVGTCAASLFYVYSIYCIRFSTENIANQKGQ